MSLGPHIYGSPSQCHTPGTAWPETPPSPAAGQESRWWQKGDHITQKDSSPTTVAEALPEVCLCAADRSSRHESRPRRPDHPHPHWKGFCLECAACTVALPRSERQTLLSCYCTLEELYSCIPILLVDTHAHTLMSITPLSLQCQS
jgi:hypothetical protein